MINKAVYFIIDELNGYRHKKGVIIDITEDNLSYIIKDTYGVKWVVKPIRVFRTKVSCIKRLNTLLIRSNKKGNKKVVRS